MKLVYLTVATIPNKTAHSKYVMKLCEAFGKLGIDTTLISNVRKEDIFNKNNVFEELNIKRTFNLKRILAPYKLFKQDLPNGIRFRYYSLAIIPYLVYYKFFVKEVVFVCHNYFTIKICEFLNLKYILDLHDDFPKLKINPLFIIVQSNVLYKQIKYKYPSTSIFISRNSIENELKYKNLDLIDCNDNFVFSYVGSLSPDRGFGDFLKVIANQNKNFIVYVAGDYERFRKYYDYIIEENSSLKKKIVFLGYLSEEEINFLSSRTDVFLTLYTTKISTIGYASPMKIFEYLRFNKRIIAPKIDDIKEIIDYYNCEDRMRWYDIDNNESLENTINYVFNEDKVASLKKINVETWDNKAEFLYQKIIWCKK